MKSSLSETISNKVKISNLKKLEKILEKAIFSARWLLIPFYVCCLLLIVILVIKFTQNFCFKVIPLVFIEVEQSEVILSILELIDLLLVANLLIIIVFSGYESFVSKFDLGENVDRPEWMSNISFSNLKLKLMGSLVTISAIDLLGSFIKVAEISQRILIWQVIIHFTFVLSGLLFAWMDKIGEQIDS
ncbi:MAG: TIGR00645 family protein [Xenococcaceae cyanobacterium MO_188.B19]|nr:TIGR00645 family protein [Xenococcaceae cyanobacterium MO_188.B19]